MIIIDPRAGSRELPAAMTPYGIPIASGIAAGDFEFIGQTPLGPTPIGGEHKKHGTKDTFDSLMSGRLTGTQLPRMVDAYPWVRYVVFEGMTRRSYRDGILELRQEWGKHEWEQAFSRKGAGITYDEYRNRIESIEEFWSWPHVTGRTIVVETPDRETTAAWLAGRYHYWQKPYDSHHSARQWDRSRDIGAIYTAADILLGTSSNLPLVQRCAREIDGIGQSKSNFVARSFKSLYRMAVADPAEWAAVECMNTIRSGDRKGQLKPVHFSRDTIAKIIEQIRGEK